MRSQFAVRVDGAPRRGNAAKAPRPSAAELSFGTEPVREAT